MADEIYINTKNAPHSQLGQLGQSGTFQQPYQGQRAVTGDLQVQRAVSGQTPFTYQARYPLTYQANARGRYPAAAQGRFPDTYQAQGRYPFTYPAIGQTPFNYQARYPFPATYQARGRYPAAARGRYPASAQGRYPFPYTYQARRPAPVNSTGRYPYIARRPTTVQQPYTYPSVGTAQGVPARTQVLTPYFGPKGGFLAQGQGPYILPGPGTYNFQVSGRRPQTYIARRPAIGRIPWYEGEINEFFQDVYAYQQPYTHTPVNQQTYSHRGTYPFTAQTLQPYIGQGNAQGRYPFNYQARYPFNYQARYPYPANYSARGRYPASAQQSFNYQANAQGRYPYPANRQNSYPFNYQARYPFTYPANARGTYPANAQQSYPFQQNYQLSYIFQQAYSTTRNIGAAAKVKAVYLNDAGTLRKLQEVYVNDQGALEKIHQTVPVSQFNKS